MARFRRIITESLRDISRIIWPDTCVVCGRALVGSERFICLGCLASLPRVSAHPHFTDEINERLLGGNAPVEQATALFRYVSGSNHSQLIKTAKYNSRPALARWLGTLAARELAATGIFLGVDLIIPIPLHWWRKARRGYNQSEQIALGISQVTGIPVARNLRSARRRSVQALHHAADRWTNTLGAYRLDDPHSLNSLRVLIVDDVLTTGATIATAADTIHQASPSTIIRALSVGATSSR